ncbi:MAG: PD-(D/E)XK nuclease family transposase [Clostridium perfringens]|nr:PD-(D/E)XK nuclease family transposase [Clostridium perfringens]
MKDVELKNTDLEKEHLGDKFYILDINTKIDKYKIINIEIQVRDEYNMIQCTLY